MKLEMSFSKLCSVLTIFSCVNCKEMSLFIGSDLYEDDGIYSGFFINFDQDGRYTVKVWCCRDPFKYINKSTVILGINNVSNSLT